MSRLEIFTPNNAQLVVENMYKEMERRIESSPSASCPIDISRVFLEFAHSQSCGKCVPCRVGLGSLINLLEKVLDGKATMDTLRVIEETALVIMQSADCAIGFEAAKLVLKGLVGNREDYIEHIKYDRCTCKSELPVPCVALCPAHVDVPGYIALIRAGRNVDAIKLIRKDNPFPTTCAFICEHPCESRCRRNLIDDAINIRGLKRYAADKAGFVSPPKCAESTGKKVVIVGGGPGGLTAAYYLQLMGHQTTVYEYQKELGGMLRYGIPNYRLPKDRLDDDINAILETGVKVVSGKKIGENISISELRENYDAVLITIGANTDKKLGIEGEDAKGVMSAVEFLRNVSKHESETNTNADITGKEVVIVGGGNVAMDAVRTAIRYKAKKVSLVYRRQIADMTALRAEIDGALSEGVEFVTLMAPKSIEVGNNGEVVGLRVMPQMLGKVRAGRPSVSSSGADEVVIPCSNIIVAIGQNIESDHFAKIGIPVESGKIITENDGGFQNFDDVFAGGDCSAGPATVIKAVSDGKALAANIDEFLGYNHEISCDIEIPSAKLEDREPKGRGNLPERSASERINDFEGIELGMSDRCASQEAGRCLRCDHFGLGIFKGGRETKW